MLPSAYVMPTAILLLVGGLLACFAGYRLFKLVLGVYGFILGALIGSSAVGGDSTTWMLAAALIGGVLGALALILAYFAGVALVGGGAAALVLHLAMAPFGREPHLLVVVAVAIAGAIVAMLLQRYVIVLTTAFGGSWTVLVAGLTLGGDGVATRAAAKGNVWIAYPFSPAPGEQWVFAAWIALGIAGTLVQLRVTAKGKK